MRAFAPLTTRRPTPPALFAADIARALAAGVGMIVVARAASGEGINGASDLMHVGEGIRSVVVY